MARSDGNRPMFLKDIHKDQFIGHLSEAMILKIKVLTPQGGEITIEWSEKIADEYAKIKAAKAV